MTQMTDTMEYIRRAHQGDKEARDALVTENMGLICSIVRRFAGRGYELEDLFQIGSIGLMKAIDKFDLSMDVKLSTYAVPMITGEIRRFLRDDGMIKVSRPLKELAAKTGAARERLELSLGREPTIEELAEELGLTREEVVEALNVSAPPLSLTVSSEEGETQIDLPVQSPEENLSERMALRQILGELEPRDRQLIILRYFMDKTQTQTAEQLGMTQVQVSRREKKLLLAMRQKLL